MRNGYDIRLSRDGPRFDPHFITPKYFLLSGIGWLEGARHDEIVMFLPSQNVEKILATPSKRQNVQNTLNKNLFGLTSRKVVNTLAIVDSSVPAAITFVKMKNLSH